MIKVQVNRTGTMKKESIKNPSGNFIFLKAENSVVNIFQ